MGIRKFKPTTPAQRWKSVSTFDEITKSKPEKSLVVPLKKSGGRNNLGRITMRRRGGGHKRKLRLVDFKRNRIGQAAEVIAIEYDPNRSARIALIQYEDAMKSYIIAPNQLQVGSKVVSAEDAEYNVGNRLPIKSMPLGAMIYNIEMKPGKGGQIARSAGNFAQLLAKDGQMAHLKMPSGEVRLFNIECWASVGQVGNIDHEKVILGKAGRNRWLGRRPKVRGVAMNPVDHPLGGGEGKSAGGRQPCTPWGKPTKGYKTRKRNKLSNKYIVKKRNKK